MLYSNKKKLLELKHVNKSPLLSSNSKGETKKFYKNSQNIQLKKFNDINGMEISYGVIKSKN